ncbi:MAG: sulfite exporter TauE/SafE family protein [Pseudolabrys sp.]|nr:sulfite exporter TauE/SafE family protein [Pseudolabrys sp.]MBV9955526.1 sulfite exporter TauE/SafE family protein [Pseudolabrys sp.]
MIDLPTAATFSAVIADPRFIAGLAIAALAGIVRGFTGFGSALIYIPLMSAVYGPLIAAPTFVIADVVTGLAFLSTTWRKAHWDEVLPMAAAAIIAAQFGTLVLQWAHPTTLRWALSVLVLSAVALLASGWRYHGKPKLIVTIAVGLLAGILGGAVQISGPPIIVYWFGSGHGADILRANFFAYFSVFSMGSVVTYALHGLLTATVLALSLFITPTTLAMMAVGTKLFHLAKEGNYRPVGYIVAILSAIASMPLFDGLLR